MVGRVDVLLCRIGEVAEVVEVENSDEGVAALLQVEDMENLSYITPWSQFRATVENVYNGWICCVQTRDAAQR